MSDMIAFSGRVLSDQRLELGEGATYDPATGTAWWFNILGKELHELHLASGRKAVHALPFMASVLARVDEDRQIIASEHGLYLRMVATGALSLMTPIEDDRIGNRSNDGRVHPCGALWFGTMGKTAADGAGSIYHVHRGVVTLLYPGISIPNGICFSMDGSTGFFVDTRKNRYMRVDLDPATGLPVSDPVLFADQAGVPGGIDGSVMAADGSLVNARWGMGRVDIYDRDGRIVRSHALPAKRTTCPAFIGADGGKLLVTSSWEGLDEAGRQADPLAGCTFEIDIGLKGVFDPPYDL